jgi:hypothetical protein
MVSGPANLRCSGRGDADLYVPGLIEGPFGSRRWMQQIGKLGGSSRSSIKTEASRENGKRGGRPKEKAAA